MYDYDAIVVGCGLSGAVAARYLAEQQKKNVLVLEQREHIGGNMYDYVNESGILVHKYGPHTFHTQKKYLYKYMCQYAEWVEFKLTCGAVINDKYTPTPFNFLTIDDFFEKQKAIKIKEAIRKEYPNQSVATVLELMNHKNDYIRNFATFLFDNDYSLYTAKQWGVSPTEIDPSILQRVPIRFNYCIGYFDDEFQVMPKISYTHFFENLLNYKKINVVLECNALKKLELDESHNCIKYNGRIFDGPIIYTGAADELFGNKYGRLPYRSLRFEWKTESKKSFQMAPVVAYPQASDFIRITEYTKLPIQNVGNITSYAIEYSIPYKSGMKTEPYYPVLTEQSQKLYEQYKKEAEKYENLYLCGRLADFKYYNMDQALERVLNILEKIK